MTDVPYLACFTLSNRSVGAATVVTNCLWPQVITLNTCASFQTFLLILNRTAVLLLKNYCSNNVVDSTSGSKSFLSAASSHSWRMSVHLSSKFNVNSCTFTTLLSLRKTLDDFEGINFRYYQFTILETASKSSQLPS